MVGCAICPTCPCAVSYIFDLVCLIVVVLVSKFYDCDCVSGGSLPFFGMEVMGLSTMRASTRLGSKLPGMIHFGARQGEEGASYACHATNPGSSPGPDELFGSYRI
eukprot:jgi/Chrzof1/10105/Cz04g27070.t1